MKDPCKINWFEASEEISALDGKNETQ